MKNIYFPILLLIIISCKQNQNNKTHEPWTISQLLEPKLLSSIIESSDKIANTAVVYGAFLKQFKKKSLEPLVLRGSEIDLSENNHEAYHKDSNELIKEISGDILYLDPPYNTPGEANTFSYNNRFNHSSWLTFMKNRIEVASKLVSDDGFIKLRTNLLNY